jgi:large subunit ribosomal protein L35
MPKMKTNRSAAKRFARTGTGRLRRRKAYHNHLNGKKSASRLRRLRRPVVVTHADEQTVRRLLG